MRRRFHVYVGIALVAITLAVRGCWLLMNPAIANLDQVSFSGEASALGYFSVRRLNDLKNIAIVVHISGDKYPLSEGINTFNIDPTAKGMYVSIHQFKGPHADEVFPRDYPRTHKAFASWIAISGTLVVVKHSDPPRKGDDPKRYKVSIEVNDVTMVRVGAEDRTIIKRIVIPNVWVGGHIG